MGNQRMPVRPEDITADWLNETLRRAGVIDASVVTDVHAEAIAVGVGFAGSLARLTVSYDRADNPRPRSIIAKHATAHGPTRELVSGLGLYEREVRFYRELASSSTLRTPRCFHGEFCPDDGNFVLLLEDLSHLRTQDQIAGCSLEDAETVARELGRFHAQHWGADSSPDLEWLPRFDAIADWAQRAFPHAWRAFEQQASDIIPEALTSVAKLAAPHMGGIIRRLAQPPITVKHGDVRLDNMFFDSSGSENRVVAIDWQLIGTSRGMYDLAYFTALSMTPEMRRQHLEKILDVYHAALTASSVDGYTLDECYEDYGYTLLYLPFFMAMAGSTLEMESDRRHMLAQAMTERLADALADIDAPALLAGLVRRFNHGRGDSADAEGKQLEAPAESVMSHGAILDGIAGITPVWLSETLRNAGVVDAASVVDMRSEAVGVGRGFSGNLTRVALTYDHAEDGAPEFVIVKAPSHSAPTPNTRGGDEREVRFYSEIAPHAAIRSLRYYFAALAPENRWSVVLLEDLSHLRAGDQVAGCELPDAERVTVELARFHAGFWDSPRLAQFPWAPPWSRGAQLFQQRVLHSWRLHLENGLYGPPAPFERFVDGVGPHIETIRRRLSRAPATINHGDFKLDNLFFDESGPIAIDWSLLRVGRGIYDLSHFLVSSLSAEMRQVHAERLITLYHETLQAAGITGYSLQDCHDDYDYAVLDQAARAQAIPRFDIGNERGREWARIMMERIADSLEKVDAEALISKLE